MISITGLIPLIKKMKINTHTHTHHAHTHTHTPRSHNATYALELYNLSALNLWDFFSRMKKNTRLHEIPVTHEEKVAVSFPDIQMKFPFSLRFLSSEVLARAFLKSHYTWEIQ